MKKILLILISINITAIHADMERVDMLFDNEERHYFVYILSLIHISEPTRPS